MCFCVFCSCAYVCMCVVGACTPTPIINIPVQCESANRVNMCICDRREQVLQVEAGVP